MKIFLLFSIALAIGVVTPRVRGSTTVSSTTYAAGGTVTVKDGSTIQTGSGATVTVSTEAAVTYEAGTSVTLNPGFTATTGSFFNAFINNNLSPGVPADLLAPSESSSYINLTWFPSTDSYGGIYYKVYRNGTYIGSSFLPTYTDTTVSSGSTYTYTVVAYDSASNSSAVSAGVSATAIAATGTSADYALLGLSSSPGTASWEFQVLQPQ